MDKQTKTQLLNIVRKNYLEIADHYSETRKRYPSPLWDALFEITKEVKDGDKILDVGCGSGRLLDFFGEQKIDYLGIDPSERMIDNAKKLHPNFDFVLGDVLELSLLPQINFDWIFSVAVFHHIPSEDLRVIALKQLKNKISDSGKIVIAVWNMWSQKRFRRLILKFCVLKLLKKNNYDCGDILFDWKDEKGEIVSQRYYHAFTKRELTKLARKADLKIEKIFKDSHNYYLVLKK